MLIEDVSTADGGAESVMAVQVYTGATVTHLTTAFQGALYRCCSFSLLLSTLFSGGKYLFFFRSLHCLSQYLLPVWAIICNLLPSQDVRIKRLNISLTDIFKR